MMENDEDDAPIQVEDKAERVLGNSKRASRERPLVNLFINIKKVTKIEQQQWNSIK